LQSFGLGHVLLQNLLILQLLDDLPGFPGLSFCYGILFQKLLYNGLGRRVHLGDGLFLDRLFAGPSVPSPSFLGLFFFTTGSDSGSLQALSRIFSASSGSSSL
jgi:hypothetical protein